MKVEPWICEDLSDQHVKVESPSFIPTQVVDIVFLSLDDHIVVSIFRCCSITHSSIVYLPLKSLKGKKMLSTVI